LQVLLRATENVRTTILQQCILEACC